MCGRSWHIFLSLLAGSLPGIFIGSYFAIRIPDRTLKVVLACTLFVVASRIAYDQIASATAAFTVMSGGVRH